MALRNIRIASEITGADITENTDTKVITLNTYYDTALEQTLMDADWNFAEAYTQLNIEYESKIINYSYAYDYPSDCIMPREIVTGVKNTKELFKVSIDYPSFKKVINTNIQNPTLRFTRKIKDEKYFTADFAMALSWYLSFLASPAVGMASEQKNALSVYSLMLNGAVTSNANEDNDIEPKESDFITARN
jgi:hypothetical protein